MAYPAKKSNQLLQLIKSRIVLLDVRSAQKKYYYYYYYYYYKVLILSFGTNQNFGFSNNNYFKIPCNTTNDCGLRRGLVCDSSKSCSCKSNYPYFDIQQMACVPKCADESFLNNYTKVCLPKIEKSLRQSSITYTCKKCKKSQFYDYSTNECKEKIKNGKICSSKYDVCSTNGYLCIKNSITDNDYYCGKCKKSDKQYLDYYTGECKNFVIDLSDGENCSSSYDQCKSPNYHCFEINYNEGFTCKYCEDYFDIFGLCFDNELFVEDGKKCRPKSDYCKSYDSACIKKNSKENVFICKKCKKNQYVVGNKCKNKIKDGKMCWNFFDYCESEGFYCLRKKPTEINFYCRKCDLKTQMIDINGICRNKIKDGKKCSSGYDTCVSDDRNCVRT